jgi:hypothetical protein
MSTMIFVSLCIAGEGFLLYCLYHFRQKLKKMSQCECDQSYASQRFDALRSRRLPSDLQAQFARVPGVREAKGRKHAA